MRDAAEVLPRDDDLDRVHGVGVLPAEHRDSAHRGGAGTVFEVRSGAAIVTMGLLPQGGCLFGSPAVVSLEVDPWLCVAGFCRFCGFGGIAPSLAFRSY
jgi:hypothetical protein